MSQGNHHNRHHHSASQPLHHRHHRMRKRGVHTASISLKKEGGISAEKGQRMAGAPLFKRHNSILSCKTRFNGSLMEDSSVEEALSALSAFTALYATALRDEGRLPSSLVLNRPKGNQLSILEILQSDLP